MTLTELLHFVCEALDRHGIEYFVTGSTAIIAYGEPRLTNDIDIVVDLPPERVSEFCREFPSDDFYISEPAVARAVQTKHHFNVIHPASGLKIDFMVLSDSAFDRSRRNRRRRLDILAGREIAFASPEDLILKKMEFHREGGSDKHLRDIAGVMRMQAAALDRDYIAQWAEKLGLSKVWKAVLNCDDAN